MGEPAGGASTATVADWNRGQVLGGDSTIPLLGGVRGGSLGHGISIVLLYKNFFFL